MDYGALAREFDRRGLLVLHEFLDAAKVDEIEHELRELVRQLGPKANGRVVYEPGPERRIRNIFHLHDGSSYFANLAQEPRFVELVRAILQDDPVLISVELFGKPARVGSEVPFHQDNAYFTLTPDEALTCWVGLADATRENGCVRYIEGSHRLGNLPHVASGVKGNSMRLRELPPGVGPELCGLVRRGGALIHHCNTIHRSEPNHSDNDRPGLLFVYRAARCQIDASRAAQYRVAAMTVANT